MNTEEFFKHFCKPNDDFVIDEIKSFKDKRNDFITKVVDPLLMSINKLKEKFKSKVDDNIRTIEKIENRRKDVLIKSSNCNNQLTQLSNLYKSFKGLCEETDKEINENIELFNKKYIQKEQPEIIFPKPINPIMFDETDDNLQIEENIHYDYSDKEFKAKLNLLKNHFPDKEDSFLRQVLKGKTTKEIYMKNQNFSKFEKFKKVMIRVKFSGAKNNIDINTPSANNQQANNKSSGNITTISIKNNIVNNINDSYDYYDLILKDLKSLFKFYSVTENKENQYILIGGKLNAETNISKCYKAINDICFKYEQVNICQIFIYRTIEDIIIDTGFRFPSNLDPQEIMKYNQNIQDLFDLRDFLKTMNLSQEIHDINQI